MSKEYELGGRGVVEIESAVMFDIVICGIQEVINQQRVYGSTQSQCQSESYRSKSIYPLQSKMRKSRKECELLLESHNKKKRKKDNFLNILIETRQSKKQVPKTKYKLFKMEVEQTTAKESNTNSSLVVKDVQVHKFELTLNQDLSLEESEQKTLDKMLQLENVNTIDLHLKSIIRTDEFFFSFIEKSRNIMPKIRFLKWDVTYKSNSDDLSKSIGVFLIGLSNIFSLDLTIQDSEFSDRDAGHLAKALLALQTLQVVKLKIFEQFMASQIKFEGKAAINESINALPNLELVSWNSFVKSNLRSTKFAGFIKKFLGENKSQDEVSDFIQETNEQLHLITYIYLLDDGAGFHFFRKQGRLFKIFLHCFSIPYLTNFDYSFLIQSQECRETTSLLFPYLNEKQTAIINIFAFLKYISDEIPIHPNQILLDLYF